MIEFFIALFGGTYWATKISKAKSQKRQGEIERKKQAEQIHHIFSSYIAPLRLCTEVEQYVSDNIDTLVNEEFKTDLEYIYGSDFLERAAQDVNAFESCHYYHVVDALECLVLAKKYNKLKSTSFAIGCGDKVPYSMRLFKRINTYLKYNGARLTLVPKIVFTKPIQYDWSPSGSRVEPLDTNTYSSYPESYAWEDLY